MLKDTSATLKFATGACSIMHDLPRLVNGSDFAISRTFIFLNFVDARFHENKTLAIISEHI